MIRAVAYADMVVCDEGGEYEARCRAEQKKYEWLNYSRAKRGAKPLELPDFLKRWIARSADVVDYNRRLRADLRECDCDVCGVGGLLRPARAIVRAQREGRKIMCDECRMSTAQESLRRKAREKHGGQ